MSHVEDQKLVTIVEEREEKMVAHSGGIPTFRLARFLKPFLTSISQATQAQAPPLSKTQAYNFKESPLTVHFKGWRFPQINWKQWVDDLKPRYGHIWKKTGIYDSIMISTCLFRRDKDLVLGLAEFWCPETNTFVFSWGEATITLEDMLIIGGFPIIGESITSPLMGELVEIEEKMIQEYREISKSKANRVRHCEWIRWFMGVNNELEHAAFLTVWLSRYIFPSKPEDKIHKHTFPVAIHLSQATPIALAPAVLASLYKDLHVLKEQIDYSSTMEYCAGDDLSVTVWAPFLVMQLWAWERFPSLQPNPKYLTPGEPRAARWHDLSSKSKLKLVRRTLNSADDFQWRPYSCILDNWRHPLYSKERGEWEVITHNTNDGLLSLARCFIPCELVGLDCNEQYLPHRVGMQFGMDQDIPGPFTRVNASWEIVWRTFRKIICYVPPRLFESDVTAQYFEWWTQSNSINDDKPKSIPVQRTSSSSDEDQSPSDEDKMTISEWHKHRSSSLVVGSSSTPNEKAMKKHLTKSSDQDLYNKASTKSENLSEVDKEVRSSICSKSYHHDVTNTYESLFPGLELEARIEKLEAIVNLFKMKRRRAVLSRTKTRASHV